MGSKKNSGRLKKILKRMGIFFIVLLVLFVVTSTAVFFKFKPNVEAAVENGDLVLAKITEESFKSREATAIYDRNGKVITEIQDHEYVYIPLSDMGVNIRNSFISIEDVRFYEHNGVDYKGLMRAGLELVKNRGAITQGGSTITQQLVKNVFLSHKQTYDRKLEEMYIAKEVEKIYSKDQIMEYYLNNIYFGRGAYGVEAAARKYFNKSAKELSIGESALLTGITNNPTYYDPVENKENAKERRDLALLRMLENGYISESEYNEAIAQEIVLDMSREFDQDFELDSSPVSFALWSATKVLMKEEGFEFKYWFDTEEERTLYQEEYENLYGQINSRLRNGGYKIYSTIDLEKQEKLQESVNSGLAGLQAVNQETGIYKVQGSAVNIDNSNGDVLAIVGGRTQDEVENMFNRAIAGHRQPGSTIKPIVTYTPAFEKGRLPSMGMNDEEIEDGPKNADKRYRGFVTLREAVERSYNTIPYKITQEYGARNVISYLEKMEFSKLSPNDNYPIISVGGFTYGATTLEMAGAYSTIARNGEFISPTGIERIENLSAKMVYENKREKVPVYDSGSAYLMTDVLKGVVYEPGATAYGMGLSNMATAGKTGTTDDNKDAWFAGYTPHYTTVVWVGSDVPQTINSGGIYSKNIWKNYMENIHSGLQYSDFQKPDRISNMYVNPSTFRVSKTPVGGWRLELVPEIYYELQTNGELGQILKSQEIYMGPRKPSPEELKKEEAKKKAEEEAEKKAEEEAEKKAEEEAEKKAEEEAKKKAEEEAKKKAEEEAKKKAEEEAKKKAEEESETEEEPTPPAEEVPPAEDSGGEGYEADPSV